MNSIRTVALAILVCGLSTILTGCGGGGADENKPVSEIRSEAEGMDADGLRNMAMAYKEAIQSKIQEIDGLQDQLKKIPALELMGEESKQLKQDIDAITKSVNALKERFKIYYDMLKQADGDLSGLKL